MSLIRSVTLHPLRIPFRQHYQIAVGEAHVHLDVVVAELHTEHGVIGLGETQVWRRDGSGETLVGLLDAMQSLLIPLLIGQSVFDIATLAQRFEQVLSGRLAAKAALLDALIDAQARTLNVPAYQLLGGRTRATIETGAVLTLRSELAETLAEAEQRYQQGYRHFSLKVGQSIARDVAAVAALRHALGDKVSLLLDANAALSFSDARHLMQRLEPYNIEALEQPLASHDIAGLQALAATSAIPLVLDESVTTPPELLHAIQQRSAQGIHTKTAKNGGLWHTRQLWHLAHAAGWRVRAGNYPATGIATHAVAHSTMAWPHAMLVSPFTSSPLHDLEGDIVTEKLQVAAGQLHLSDAPGWGVTLDREQLARWSLNIATGENR